MCGSAAERCGSPPGHRELQDGPGRTPLVEIAVFFQPGLPLTGRGAASSAPASQREAERCVCFFARRPPQAPRAALLPGLLQYRGEAGHGEPRRQLAAAPGDGGLPLVEEVRRLRGEDRRPLPALRHGQLLAQPLPQVLLLPGPAGRHRHLLLHQERHDPLQKRLHQVIWK